MCTLKLSTFGNIFSEIENAVNTFSIPEKNFSKKGNYCVPLRHTLAKSYLYIYIYIWISIANVKAAYHGLSRTAKVGALFVHWVWPLQIWLLEASVVSTLAFCFDDFLTNYGVGTQTMTAASGGTGFELSVFVGQHGGSRLAAYTATHAVNDFLQNLEILYQLCLSK